ncbi:ParB N-terminal domain-containing protein [Plantactinospora alkalitolerans]|uniref:ParB N-terminal domain-containing protein n=1 Tax=Plantactinospora alkalitolerans TaxID=2789879 RepID=UPI002B22039B|nr:ParB N-terminal domain-containing protein [Plantactinospora alkalitolerans]
MSSGNHEGERKSPPLPRGGPGSEGRRHIALVAVSDLLPADSPRLAGEDLEHVRVLAESKDALPPIVVHRPTMRVVDGMHRLRAAALRGAARVRVVFIDGVDEADLFVLAVKANIAHGLPLTLAERRAAAARIVKSHPQMSDRTIARVTGLSDKTVRTIRSRAPEVPRLGARIGQDGKRRPLSSADGRRLAGEILRTNPRASLRQVAKAAGISVGTAHDVRRRMMRGEDPVAARRDVPSGRPVSLPVPTAKQIADEGGRIDRRGREAGSTESAALQDPGAVLEMLMRDPVLRYTDSGRALLRWLSIRQIHLEEQAGMLERVPPHCMGTVATYARRLAESWAQFASQLEQREQREQATA